MRRRLLILLLASLAVTVTATATASSSKLAPLTAAQVPALLKPPLRGERVVMFWALDCAYCEPNMRVLAKLQHAHPHAVELITVDTDDITLSSQITRRLDADGMQGYPAYAYVAAVPQQMNFLIDPDWGGETPRTLVIRADGTRIAISGELSPDQLRRIAPQ